MKITRAIALAVIVASCGLGYAQAKALKDAGEPAEFPPSSYTGRQYVDSKGCVFIRAGIDGNVTWVPRVSRGRQTVCGYQPSLAKAPAPAPAAKPATKPASVVAAAPAPKPAPRVVKAAPQPVRAKPVPTARVPVAAAPVVVTAPAPKPKPKPKKVVATAPAPERRVVQAPTGCPGRSAVSQRYMGGSYAVRCGPQSAEHVTYSTNAAAPRRVAPVPIVTQVPTYTAPSYQPSDTAPRYQTSGTTHAAVPSAGYTTATRVAPKHVYENQVASSRGLSGIPEGYKRVWVDGRLNPHRAHQNFAGKAQMDLVWTKTVPRQLFVRETGQVVTPAYPGLMYPYTSYEQQARANVSPAYAVRQARSYGSTGAAPAYVTQTPTVSTRSSATVPSQPEAAASHRFVQAGVFTTRAQAQQAAQRVAGSGLPARLGTMRRNGKTYSLVLAGPFSSQSKLNSALSRVRGAGFNNAKLLK
nr:SPOR domain-containing protein [uncultured Roseovarius sp.]